MPIKTEWMTTQDLAAFGAADIGNEDMINAPSHYARFKSDPVTMIMLNEMEFWRGNIIKYSSRAGYKLYPDSNKTESEIIDLKKVMRYAEMRINMLEGREVTFKK